MDEENKNGQNNQPEKYEGKAFAYVAIALVLAGAAAFGVSFTKLGIYALIASMLLEIGAMTFINIQKNKNNLSWLFYLKIAAYVLFAASVIVFALGTIWSAQK